MDRRYFLKIAGTSVAVSSVPSTQAESSPTAASTPEITKPRNASIGVQDNTIHIDTPTQSAVIEKGILTSLKSKITAEVFIRDVDVSVLVKTQWDRCSMAEHIVRVP